MTLPDCMMPDGADPCRGYQELRAEVEALREPVEDSAAFRLRFPGEVKKIQEEAREELRAEVEALRRDAERYQLVRQMTPAAFIDVWKLNANTGKPFDEIIDNLMPFAAMAKE